MNQVAGTRFVMVHYRGSAPAIIGVQGGEAALHFASGVDAMPQIRSGRMRALAVAGERRSILAPDVLTTAEAGVPGLTANVWHGLLAPARTPPAIVDRLRQEVAQILDEPAVRQKLVDLSAEPATSTPDEFAAMIRSQLADYARIVKAANIRTE